MKKIYVGAAYYPEVWEPSEVDADIVRMQEAGVNVVRLGEFAWVYMEPEEDVFTLDWLKTVVDKLYAAGIDVIMCTPSCTPPASSRDTSNKKDCRVLAWQPFFLSKARFQRPAQVPGVPGLLALEIALHKGPHPPALGLDLLCKAQRCAAALGGELPHPAAPQAAVFQAERPAAAGLLGGDGEPGGNARWGVLHKGAGAGSLHPGYVRAPGGVCQIRDHLPHLFRRVGQRYLQGGRDHGSPSCWVRVLPVL